MTSASGSSASLTTASGVRIHGVQTGNLSIKAAHRRYGGPAPLRLPAILLDRQWTEPLPMLAWIIEHPEGLIVIDTGEVAAATHPHQYLENDPNLRWFVERNFQIRVGPHEDIAAQMERLGLNPADVRTVVQTHLHFDHVGGLRYFPFAEVLVGKTEFERPPQGAARSLWPAWYQPTLVQYRRTFGGAFPERHVLTRAGDVQLMPTPGHTDGHQSVMLDDGQVRYLFAGDAAFSEERLLRGEVPGIVQDVRLTRQTNTNLRRFVDEAPTVVLPSHDPASLSRLSRRAVTVISS